MDDDREDGAKSVDENPHSAEIKNSQKIIGAPGDGKDEGRSGLTDDTVKNIKRVGTVFNDESESEQDLEEFEDALEDCNEATEARSNSDIKDDEIGDEEGDDETVEEALTPEEKEEKKIQALECKDKGNEYFKRSEYPEAREYYTMAIKICPKCFAKEKSIFYANRAACLIKMDHNKEATEDCTKALDLNPDYHKARLRRAQCYEHEDRLEEALEDYQKVFDADRSSQVARDALMRLPEQIKIKHEKMKEEMIGKLKELGNVVLRPFGLSTDNFKLQQDPNTGGYSINFQNSK